MRDGHRLSTAAPREIHRPRRSSPPSYPTGDAHLVAEFLEATNGLTRRRLERIAR